jgi:hypothetical protein
MDRDEDVGQNAEPVLELLAKLAPEQSGTKRCWSDATVGACT